jgi:hypothetical protein
VAVIQLDQSPSMKKGKENQDLYAQPLTAERLFVWHSALFPTARSGMRLITVGAWRPVAAGPMQVVAGRNEVLNLANG